MYKVRCKLQVVESAVPCRYDENKTELRCKEVEGNNYVSLISNDESFNSFEEGDVLGVEGVMSVKKSESKTGKVYVNITISKITEVRLIGQMRFEF